MSHTCTLHRHTHTRKHMHTQGRRISAIQKGERTPCQAESTCWTLELRMHAHETSDINSISTTLQCCVLRTLVSWPPQHLPNPLKCVDGVRGPAVPQPPHVHPFVPSARRHAAAAGGVVGQAQHGAVVSGHTGHRGGGQAEVPHLHNHTNTHIRVNKHTDTRRDESGNTHD